jgi:hypothetical protein
LQNERLASLRDREDAKGRVKTEKTLFIEAKSQREGERSQQQLLANFSAC